MKIILQYLTIIQIINPKQCSFSFLILTVHLHLSKFYTSTSIIQSYVKDFHAFVHQDFLTLPNITCNPINLSTVLICPFLQFLGSLHINFLCLCGFVFKLRQGALSSVFLYLLLTLYLFFLKIIQYSQYHNSLFCIMMQDLLASFYFLNEILIS